MVDVGLPRPPRFDGVLFGHFVVVLDRGAAVEARVRLLVVEGGAVGVGGRALGVAGCELGLSGGFEGTKGGGEGTEAAEGWGFVEDHCGEVVWLC